MRKTVTGLLTVILVGVFAAVVFAAVDSSSGTPAGTTTEDRTTTTGDDTTTTEDRAKHREDRGVRREDRRNDRRDDRGRVRGAGEDISGPCDEAEHAGDPRCNGVILPSNAGGQTQTTEDRNEAEHHRGRGADDDATDDRSGPGRGGDDSADDNSGSGHSDDGADDHSGSGHGGGGDDDSSGHGGGSDD